MWPRSNFLRSFFWSKFAFHLRIKSSRSSMHRNLPARDRLISDSRRALQFRGDSRPHSLLIIRGNIIDRYCAILSRSYRIKSTPRRAIEAIRKVHPLFSPRPTPTVNLEPAVQFCRANQLPFLQIIFAFQKMPEADRSECSRKIFHYFMTVNTSRFSISSQEFFTIFWNKNVCKLIIVNNISDILCVWLVIFI